eukprot:Sspe_Gene.38403::Locus_18508_Transcript_1_1_Confidence_1.000_Length_658::g.38403::m.38403
MRTISSPDLNPLHCGCLFPFFSTIYLNTYSRGRDDTPDPRDLPSALCLHLLPLPCPSSSFFLSPSSLLPTGPGAILLGTRCGLPRRPICPHRILPLSPPSLHLYLDPLIPTRSFSLKGFQVNPFRPPVSAGLLLVEERASAGKGGKEGGRGQGGGGGVMPPPPPPPP